MSWDEADSPLAKLWRTLSARRRGELVGVVFLMLLGAGAELGTLASVVPFLQLLAEGAESDGSSPVSSMIAPTAIFVTTALIASLVKLGLLWVSQRYAMALSHDLSMLVFTRALHQPYSHYVRSNTSKVLAGLEGVNAITVNVLLVLMQSAVAFVLSVSILAFLVVLQPVAAMATMVVFGVVYGSLTLASRRRLATISARIASGANLRVKTVQESFGSLRDIILDDSYELYTGRYERVTLEQRNLATSTAFAAQSPRYLLEFVAILLIAGLAVWFSSQQQASAIIGLGTLALGAQRLLPLVQQLFVGWAQYNAHRGRLVDLLRIIDGPTLSRRPYGTLALGFQREIELRAVSFRYEDTPTLCDVSLVIPKGRRVAFIGRTGSGKSTLVDLVMGLLEVESGAILVDGVPIDAGNRQAWQAQVSHVPQSIFLVDDTLAVNIAFGGLSHAPMDLARVREAARKASLEEFVAGLPDGFDTMVGERGIRLSGGQRQRIGLARAFYKRASVLVLDEATSALDADTEAAVMASIRDLERDLTVILIAHRLSTVAFCDEVFVLAEGRIVRSGAFSEVVAEL